MRPLLTFKHRLNWTVVLLVMGIQGLLPFLKKIHTPINISQYHGCTVAIDAYCWLHKGAFACAEKLALGEKTDQYVYYCMKYIDFLLRNGLKPILVFDGCHLPSKKDVEISRRERRETNRKRAAQFLREGKRAEARECLQRCVDITPQMALELMNVCRSRGVDCIVAPYEADAQLAYLSKAGIAQIIVTEDSDLLLFGCEKVIFKMDFYGNGILIEQSRLNEVVEIQDGFYTFEKFRYMCILSGCDYLPSIPGIGLVKACRLFRVARQTDIRQVLKKLPSYLKMNVVVTEEYMEGFIRADSTFLYQLAFDPLTRKLCPLNPYPPEVCPEELKYAGSYFPDEKAYQIALGNIDIHNMQRIGDFDPQTYVPKYAKKQNCEMLHFLSIWQQGYRPHCKTDLASKTISSMVDRPSLAGTEVELKNNLTKPKKCSALRKRAREADDGAEVKSNAEFVDMYCGSEKKLRKSRHNSAIDRNDILSCLDTFEDENELDRSSLSIETRSSPSERSPEMKKVLSPSKPVNQALLDSKMTIHCDPFVIIEKELDVNVICDKENGKIAAHKLNKFAVSSLPLKTKFSLDSSSSDSIKVDVKSRYFTSSSSITVDQASADIGIVNKDICLRLPSSDSVSNISEDCDVRNVKSAVNVEEESSISCADLWPRFQYNSTKSVTQRPTREDSKNKTRMRNASVKNEVTPSLISSFTTEVNHVTLPRAGPNNLVINNLPKPISGSPNSAFIWSRFQFSRSSSAGSPSSPPPSSAGSKMPFKRVVSESTVFACSPSLTSLKKRKLNHRIDPGDKAGNCEKSKSTSHSAPSSVHVDVASCGQSPDLFTSRNCDVISKDQPNDSDIVAMDPSCSQRGEDLNQSQQSDRDSLSQHSNLYSLDSDCFPTSQDFVDLSDSIDDGSTSSQPLKTFHLDCPEVSLSCSQVPKKSPALLKSPTAIPQTSSGHGVKKCRVSGLSRGKVKAFDGKHQQKMHSFLSRFVHQKTRPTDKLQPDNNAEKW